MNYRAYVFDAYGTLFDVHSAVRKHADRLGDAGARVSEIWRNKQLEYTWTRTLIGKHLDFWELTRQGLEFALAATGTANPETRDLLLSAYRTLDCYPEIPEVLAALKQRGAKLAILSNGSPNMLADAVQSAGLTDLLHHVLSIEAIGRYKPVAGVYGIATAKLGLAPAEIAFQSSNRWDIAGATAFGMQCHWINRTSQPDEYADLPPVKVLRDLSGLL